MARSEALRDDRRAARARELELVLPSLGTAGRGGRGTGTGVGGEIDPHTLLDEEDSMMGGPTQTRRSTRTRAGLTSTGGQSSKQRGGVVGIVQRPRYQYLTSVTQLSEGLLDVVSVYGFITT